jgi:hypothetical protein
MPGNLRPTEVHRQSRGDRVADASERFVLNTLNSTNATWAQRPPIGGLLPNQRAAPNILRTRDQASYWIQSRKRELALRTHGCKMPPGMPRTRRTTLREGRGLLGAEPRPQYAHWLLVAN